jgi:hypothetical protein
MSTGDCFLENKQQERETDHSISPPPQVFMLTYVIKHRNNFTFLLLFDNFFLSSSRLLELWQCKNIYGQELRRDSIFSWHYYLKQTVCCSCPPLQVCRALVEWAIQANWHRGNILDSYSRGASLYSQLGYRLSGPTVFVVFLSLSRYMPV